MSVPYFPLYVADYEADTAHLTLEEDGAYLRLLRLCWRTPGCSIPNDPKWIARMMRVTWEAYERVVAPILSEFFRLKHNRYYSPRLQKEWERIEGTHRARSDAGKKGNTTRWQKQSPPDNALKTNEMSDRPAIAKVSHPEPEPYNTNPNGLDGEAVAAAIWHKGIKFLVAHGSPEERARKMIGKWRKDFADRDIFDALADCKREGIVDPIPWITARLSQPKVDLKKLAQEMIDELTSSGRDEANDGSSVEKDRPAGYSWQRGGSEERDQRAGQGGDEARAARRLGDVVAGIRGRAFEPDENARMADSKRDRRGGREPLEEA